MDVQALDAGFAFISYAHADLGYVRRLAVSLERRGAAVWYDERIPTGELWENELCERVQACAALVVVMSPAAADSTWVRKEVELARSADVPILPLLLAGEPLDYLTKVQYEPVLDRRMPTDQFVARLPRRPGWTQQPMAATPVIGSIPGRADCFQDRDLLGKLEEALAARNTAVVTQVLTGLGGVGKTQLAVALCRLFLDSSLLDVLVWATAKNKQGVLTTYALAGHLMCGADESDPEAASGRFLEWLATTRKQWMVVLDDVADPHQLKGLWPPESRTGRVVATTRLRDAAIASHGKLIQVDVFTPEEARAYLQAKFTDRPDRLIEADELAADIGYLPLMLGQAAAYIHNQNLTCAHYRTLLSQAKRLVDVVPEPGRVPDDYELTVAASLILSVPAADRLRPAGLATPLLDLLSMVDPNGIPDDVLTAPAALAYLGQHRTASTKTTVTAQQALDGLAVLAQFNLVDLADMPASHGRETRRGQLVRVHAMLQHAARDRIGSGDLGPAAHAVADALIEAWPDVERDTAFAQALRTNTVALRAVAEDQLWEPDGHALLFRAGRSLGEAGLVVAAAEHFQALATRATKRLGPDHPDTLTTRHNLAYWRGEAGDPAGAATATEALLADYLRVLGPDHPQTLTTRHDLAYLRGEAGDPAGAATATEALLADYLRVLGPDHPQTLTTRHNLAYWRAKARHSGPPKPAASKQRSRRALWRWLTRQGR